MKNLTKNLGELLSLYRPVPADWFVNAPKKRVAILGCVPCNNYADLVDTWKQAIYWTDRIDIAFGFMLAIVASTKLQGAQVWGRILGAPGSAKSTLCDALTINQEYTFSMDMQTGLHSGQEGQDIFQLIDGKTVVINEGDMLVNAPNRDQTLAQIRSSWGGKIDAHYRNGVSYSRAGMRTTYIWAGTANMRKLNRSAAGDRFLDCMIYERTKGQQDPNEQEMLMMAADTEDVVSRCLSDGKLESQDDPKKVLAMRMTGGFVKYLREQGAGQVEKLECPREIKRDCMQLGQLIAYMRARPDEKMEGEETEVELATRLTRQLVRLSKCSAMVLGRPIDTEVMRRIATIAYDTCRGTTFKVAKALIEKPLDSQGIAAKTGYTTQTARNAITTLATIGCIRRDDSHSLSGATGRNKGLYRLSVQMTQLLQKLRSLKNA